MPNPQKFLHGFGFKKGMVLAGYKLSSISIEHKIINIYREYGYPIKMKWITTSNQSNFKNFESALHNLTSKQHIIDSGYGNPYDSVIHTRSINKTNYGVKVLLEGHATRIFN